ncbi:MAG: hypothetical protein FJZ47_18045, partial [Candidatus Tectomicrobia bacterium]|nr:hypothetical protein [Candidatus Tectomicrobia bacterium]
MKHRDSDGDGRADCGFGSVPPGGQSLYGYAYGAELPRNNDLSPTDRLCNTADDAEWRFRNVNFNPLYFHPNTDYPPWPGMDAAGRPFQNMPVTAARDNPYDPTSRTLDLTRNTSAGDPNVVGDGFRYYTWQDGNGNGLFDDGEETVHFVKDASPDIQQKFANWFSYYCKREYVVKAAYGDLIARTAGVRIGLVTLHNNERSNPYSPSPNVTSINTSLRSIDAFPAAPNNRTNTDPAQGNRRVLLDALYSFHAEQATPLRAILRRVGEYLENANPGQRPLFPNDDAYLTADQGGACQQSFAIMMTDGLESGVSPQVGNTDNPSGPSGRTAFNGGPYADRFRNTLADVAMHYYQRDLRPDLPDTVPISPIDQARHQHMVTYTVTFSGFNGTLPNNPTPTTDGLTFWPNPFLRGRDQHKIDDLRHAAFNGRGAFFQANDASSLAEALRNALAGVAQRTASAASAVLNSGVRNTNSRVFQARFDSGNWSGQLLSIKIDPVTGVPSRNPADIVDSGALLDQLLRSNNFNTGVRNIFTYQPSTASGIPFQWAELDPEQQRLLNIVDTSSGTVDTNGRARVDYLRGSNIDEGRGHGFRVRTHRLGDIINSSPFFLGPPDSPDTIDPNFQTPGAQESYAQFRDDPRNRNRVNMILVGSNDGMLHIFNANNPLDPVTGRGDPNAGQELLAYVPNSVLKNTVDLTSPQYKHRYYVDGAPMAGDVFLSRKGWRTVAVGGLNSGGQGYFALDVTDPAAFQEDATNARDTVLWEFSDADDPDLGFSFNQASLVRMANGQWAAVFGSGYNNTEPDGHVSGTGRAVFFVVFLDGPDTGGRWVEGVNYIKIDTGVGDVANPNGLATPAVVDINGDFAADYLVAGDLRGNLWRVDVTSQNPNDWKQASNVSRLFVATSASGTPQPITTRPEVGKHPENLPGFVVYFGTGKYLEATDNQTTGAPTQTFYAIVSGTILAWGHESPIYDRLVRDAYRRLPLLQERRTSVWDS